MKLKKENLEKIIKLSNKFQKKFGGDYYVNKIYEWCKEFRMKYNHDKLECKEFIEKQVMFFYRKIKGELNE